MSVREHPQERTGGVAVAIRAVVAEETIPEEIEVPELTLPHRYLTVRDVSNRDIVTVIELLSPWNKTGKGLQEYREKQTELLLSEANLVEIDLLRSGQHTVAVPVSRISPSDYRVCIHRGMASRFGLIGFGIRDPLPTFRIPLRHEDAGALLHLGDAFDRCYQRGPYPFSTDYSQPPDPPLAPTDAAWAAEQIAQSRSARS